MSRYDDNKKDGLYEDINSGWYNDLSIEDFLQVFVDFIQNKLDESNEKITNNRIDKLYDFLDNYSPEVRKTSFISIATLEELLNENLT